MKTIKQAGNMCANGEKSDVIIFDGECHTTCLHD